MSKSKKAFGTRSAPYHPVLLSGDTSESTGAVFEFRDGSNEAVVVSGPFFQMLSSVTADFYINGDDQKSFRLGPDAPLPGCISFEDEVKVGRFTVFCSESAALVIDTDFLATGWE
jgi:hypothetical protein